MDKFTVTPAWIELEKDGELSKEGFENSLQLVLEQVQTALVIIADTISGRDVDSEESRASILANSTADKVTEAKDFISYGCRKFLREEGV